MDLVLTTQLQSKRLNRLTIIGLKHLTAHRKQYLFHNLSKSPKGKTLNLT